MDKHELIRLEAKKNVSLVISFVVFIALFIFFYLVLYRAIAINNLSIIGGIVLFVILIIFLALTVYWGTIIKEYNDLYRGAVYSNDTFKKMLGIITSDKIIMPYGLFESNDNFRQIYFDGVYSHFYSLPNASLPDIVRCLDAGLKEKFKTLEKDIAIAGNDKKFVDNINAIVKMRSKQKPTAIEEIHLFDWIEASQGYYPKHKETLQYLRQLRNLIHDVKVIKDSDSRYALTQITEVINFLYPLPTLLEIQVKCRICGKPHRENIKSELYYIGNKLQLECTNKELQKEDRYYTITLLPSRDKIH